jgi:hypothetical protein
MINLNESARSNYPFVKSNWKINSYNYIFILSKAEFLLILSF